MTSKHDIKTNTVIQGVYLPNHGKAFTTFIRNLLIKMQYQEEYVDFLTNDKNMCEYRKVFTSNTINISDNYENYEQFGDKSFNKFINDYFYKKFPILKQPKFVKIVARLVINYSSKHFASKFAEDLGFWDYIAASNDIRERCKKTLLEDTFEAFIGCCEYLITNKENVPGFGYVFIYTFLEKIFDSVNISLKYEDLFDAKTRLKELHDIHFERIGAMKTKIERTGVTNTCFIYRYPSAKFGPKKNTTSLKNDPNTIINWGQTQQLIGMGCGATQSEAEQNASSNAIDKLKELGFTKPVPEIWQELSPDYKKPITQKHNVMSLLKGADINDMLTKHENGVPTTFTALHHYCREKNIEGIFVCFDLAADPNNMNHIGLYCTDLVLLHYDKEFAKEYLDIFKNWDLKITKNVLENFKETTECDDEFFSNYNITTI